MTAFHSRRPGMSGTYEDLKVWQRAMLNGLISFAATA